MIRLERHRLKIYAQDVLAADGMEAAKAAVTAMVLVEADMMGHETHGVELLPWYVDALRDGSMNGCDIHAILANRGASFVWHGNSFPGAWLVTKALEQAADRVAEHGVVTAAIRDSHHTCALSSFMRLVTDKGLIVQISSSNPAAERMAPSGGTVPLLKPNPMGIGFPTKADPILIDISWSITTVTMANALAKRGERFPEAWAETADGTPSDDPREFTERGGSLLPLGGKLKGNKGYAMALMVELLGQGLSGKGRANTEIGKFAQSAFIQVIDPEAFLGMEVFLEQSDHLAESCPSNPPAANATGPVRVPGDAAARKRREALAEGVTVSETDLEAIAAVAESLGVPPLPVFGGTAEISWRRMPPVRIRGRVSPPNFLVRPHRWPDRSPRGLPRTWRPLTMCAELRGLQQP